MIKVYCLDNSKLSRFEISSKGWRPDIYAEIITTHQLYHLRVYDTIRLKQDFDREFHKYGYFNMPSNLILVNEVTNQNIKFTVEKLMTRGFFDNLKQMQLNEIAKIESKLIEI